MIGERANGFTILIIVFIDSSFIYRIFFKFRLKKSIAPIEVVTKASIVDGFSDTFRKNILSSGKGFFAGGDLIVDETEASGSLGSS